MVFPMKTHDFPRWRATPSPLQRFALRVGAADQASQGPVQGVGVGRAGDPGGVRRWRLLTQDLVIYPFIMDFPIKNCDFP